MKVDRQGRGGHEEVAEKGRMHSHTHSVRILEKGRPRGLIPEELGVSGSMKIRIGFKNGKKSLADICKEKVCIQKEPPAEVGAGGGRRRFAWVMKRACC